MCAAEAQRAALAHSQGVNTPAHNHENNLHTDLTLCAQHKYIFTSYIFMFLLHKCIEPTNRFYGSFMWPIYYYALSVGWAIPVFWFIYLFFYTDILLFFTQYKLNSLIAKMSNRLDHMQSLLSSVQWSCDINGTVQLQSAAPIFVCSKLT